MVKKCVHLSLRAVLAGSEYSLLSSVETSFLVAKALLGYTPSVPPT